MSYLLQYTRRLPFARRAPLGARLDERIRLNYPEFDGGAEVRVFVEDTSVKTSRQPPSPRLKLRISDCVNSINLEFAVESPALRDNSAFKLATLIGALTRFHDAFAAEASLYAEREHVHR